MRYYYVTMASGEGFIRNQAQYAVMSLLNVGISSSDVHIIVNTKKDKKLFRDLVPDVDNLHVLNEDLSAYVWKYMGGKRKYAVLKSAGIHKVFPKPISGRYLVMFDGDVLWYRNPVSFLDTKKDKTWFHHGKGLAKRALIPENKVDVTSYKSLSKWCRPAFAYLLVKYGVRKLPQREVNSGFYILHPRDHEELPKWSYYGCQKISKKFRKDGSAGEQCPLNAALCKLDVDWHGGSRWLCLEHEKYFEHFFGDVEYKKRFRKTIKEMGLR